MRCSLLTLSSHLDRELPPDRAAELEAHLVGCARCRSGLGHLHEEAERIGGLARVWVPEDSVRDLLVEVGLLGDTEPLPGRTSWPEPTPPSSGSPPWLGPRAGRALPWEPRQPLRQETSEGDTAVLPLPFEAPEPLQPPVQVTATPRHQAVEAPPGHDPFVEIAGTAQVAAPAEPEAAVPTLAEPEAAVPTLAEPQPDAETPQAAPEAEPEPPPLLPLQAPPARSLLGGVGRRARDAVAVRLALLRTAEVAEEPAARGPRPEPEPTTAPHRSTTAPLGAQPAPVVVDPPPAAISDPSPETTPGRHVRSLRQGAGGGFGRSVAQLRGLPLRLGSRGHHGASGRRDVWAWLFVAATVLLLVIGLLLGKDVTTPSRGTPASASALPSAAATAVSRPAGSAAPSAAATAPPVATPSPLQLTGVETIGSGGGGFRIQDVRYGAHPGDYRVVFDMVQPGAAGGTPSVEAGFGAEDTLYVVITGAIAAGPPPSPVAGGAITAARLLQPSPIPGKTVYEFTLARGARLSLDYLRLPTRLVLDLT